MTPCKPTEAAFWWNRYLPTVIEQAAAAKRELERLGELPPSIRNPLFTNGIAEAVLIIPQSQSER